MTQLYPRLNYIQKILSSSSGEIFGVQYNGHPYPWDLAWECIRVTLKDEYVIRIQQYRVASQRGSVTHFQYVEERWM